MAIGKQTEQEASVKSIGVPYVKNTFLCVGPAPEAAPPRSISLSPKGSSDGFARQLHALLYRPTPVRPASRFPGTPSEAASRKVCRFAEPESTKNTLSSTATTLSSTTFASSGDETGSVTDLGELLPATPQSLASPRFDAAPVAQKEKEKEKEKPRWINAVDSPRNYAVEKERPQQTERVLSAEEMALLPSIGSAGHEEGSCRPCVFAHSDKKACENGKNCPFCHFLHPPKKRVRLCKKKRMELKRHQEEQQRAGMPEEATGMEKILSAGVPPHVGPPGLLRAC